jgi:DNA-binding GntR family transcriptional regulator
MLLAGIADGTYPPGTRLPSENDIAQTAGVARLTARRAFTWLTEQGIVQAFPGRGTFVRPVLPSPLPTPPDGVPL